MKEYDWKPIGYVIPKEHTSKGGLIQTVCAGHVRNKKEGLAIVKMINSLVSSDATNNEECFITGTEPAVLETNPKNPNEHIVKIFADKEHILNLRALFVICAQDNKISTNRITFCKSNCYASIINRIYNETLEIMDVYHERNITNYNLERINKKMYQEINQFYESIYER